MKIIYCFYIITILMVSCSNNRKDKAQEDSRNQQAVPEIIVGIGKIQPEHDIIQLSSPVNGIVQKINKNENDLVTKGATVLELNHDLDDAKVMELSREIAAQQAQIKADEASVAEYRARAENAVSELQRLQNLLKKGAETQQTVDNARTNLEVLRSGLKRLSANLEVSRSRLAKAKSTIRVAETERDQKVIKSPVNGKVLEISTLIGSAVDNRQAFAQINPECRTIAVCEVDELFAGKVMTGQKGLIRNVGSADILSTGTVYFASDFLKKKSLFTDQAGEKEDRRVRVVKLMLDHPGQLLLNSRVECVIKVQDNSHK
jgi:multidrug efflux pump subunit AcrA (membrane-fusion protein)